MTLDCGVCASPFFPPSERQDVRLHAQSVNVSRIREFVDPISQNHSYMAGVSVV